MIRFMLNGLKSDKNGNKLEKAWYSRLENGSIRVYAKEYGRFSSEIQRTFSVSNDTDSQTDYFDKDDFVVAVESEYHQAADTAERRQELKRCERMMKWAAKRGHSDYFKEYSAKAEAITKSLAA